MDAKQNIKTATELFAVILSYETDEKHIVELLEAFLEGVKLNWEYEKLHLS